MYYLKVFFLYSICGFIFESTFVKMLNSSFKSGILFGPWTPVYGIGVIVIILLYKWIKKYIKNDCLKGMLLFLFSAIILSLLELLGGVLIELIFNKVFWSYENMRYNLGHYISLEIACIWGIMAIVLIYLVKPLFDKVIKRIPNWLIYILIILFVSDIGLTFIIK